MPYQPVLAFGRTNGARSNPKRRITLDAEIGKCDNDIPFIPTSENVDVGVEEAGETPSPDVNDADYDDGSIGDWISVMGFG